MHIEPVKVRSDVLGIFAEMKSRSQSDFGLSTQFEKVELVLLFFVDFMIADVDQRLASEWMPGLAAERNELGGENRFFEMLDDELHDSSPQAAERIAVYYTCLGLGFTGAFFDNPEYVHRKMEECLARIRHMADADYSKRLVEDNELHVNTANLIEPPGRSLMGIGVALVALVVVLFVGNILLYRSGTNELARALQNIQRTLEPGSAGG
jgi:type VI protein secretion system component VasF